MEERIKSLQETLTCLENMKPYDRNVSEKVQEQLEALKQEAEDVLPYTPFRRAVDDLALSRTGPLEPYDNWVAESFRDNNYRLCQKGETLCDAFAVAHKTTVSLLRTSVAFSASMEEFVTKKNAYNYAKQQYPILLDRLQQTPRNTRTYVTLYDAVQEVVENKTRYSWLENVNNLDSYQHSLLSDPKAWDESEILAKIQYTTRTKAVVVGKNALGDPVIYQTDAYSPESWQPEHYVILTHPEFSLVSYAGRILFQFEEELPYSLRQAMPP